MKLIGTSLVEVTGVGAVMANLSHVGDNCVQTRLRPYPPPAPLPAPEGAGGVRRECGGSVVRSRHSVSWRQGRSEEP